MPTKGDIADARNEMTAIRGDIKLLSWMLGVVAGGVAAIMAGMVSLIIKAYF